MKPICLGSLLSLQWDADIIWLAWRGAYEHTLNIDTYAHTCLNVFDTRAYQFQLVTYSNI